MNREREKKSSLPERVERRLSIVEELKENKKLWAIVGLATSIGGLIITLKYLSREKARDEETKSSLEKIARDVEEKYAPASERLGEGAILIAAPEVAQDLEELKKTKGGQNIFRWLEKICGALKGSPRTTEEQLILASTIAGERIVKPELEIEVQIEKPPTTRSELRDN